jgi:5'-nucleotidase
MMNKMKRVFRELAMIAMASLLSLTVSGQTKQLVVLHTNDTHSTIYPLNPNLADTLKAGRGGFIRRITMLREERKKNPGLLLFDSGDFCQGSPYYTMYKGDVEVGLMNRMGYDAGAIGNHELDYGLENMARLFKNLNFPIVCSNYDFADTELASIVKPYIVVKKKGVKIGIFALAPKLEGLVSTKNYGPLKFLDPSEVARKMVDVLKNQKKCDLVVCISHLGWQVSEYPCDQVIREVSGIDLVLDGHTHTYLPTLEYVTDPSGRRVPVDQNGKHAVFVGRLELTLDARK